MRKRSPKLHQTRAMMKTMLGLIHKVSVDEGSSSESAKGIACEVYSKVSVSLSNLSSSLISCRGSEQGEEDDDGDKKSTQLK